MTVYLQLGGALVIEIDRVTIVLDRDEAMELLERLPSMIAQMPVSLKEPPKPKLQTSHWPDVTEALKDILKP